MEQIAAYHFTVLAMGVAGTLLMAKLIAAAIAGKTAAHTPGTPIEADHGSFIFRANRALGNMNESISIFIIFALVGILSAADPAWLARLAWVYILARAVFMLSYWFNIKPVRAVAFAVSMLTLLGLGGVMFGGLLG